MNCLPGLRSITLRLALLFGSASTLVLIGVGFIIGALVELHFEKLDQHELGGKLELTRHLLAKVHQRNELEGATRQLDEALIGHHGLSIWIVRQDGQTIHAARDAQLSPALLQQPVDENRPFVWQQDGHTFRILLAHAATGEATGALSPLTVVVALDIGHHQSFMASFKYTLWSAVLVGVLTTILLGWLAARRGLAPMRVMVDAAQAVSASQLSARLSLSSVPTELLEMAQSFNAMLARLEDSFERLGNFSSDLAHELRTPVSNLMTETQVALAKPRSAEAYREILYSNMEEYERLARMIADMLFIAKADNGLIIPRRESVDLAKEIDALIEYYQLLADEKNIRLSRSGEAILSGEKLMLRRAIGNLLSNALRHTPIGGSIALHAEKTAKGTLVSVENSGSEIPAAHLPRLFDRFYQADASRQRHSDGAGLGLAIVKSIVETHRGSITVKSGNGCTTFSMQFPD